MKDSSNGIYNDFFLIFCLESFKFSKFLFLETILIFRIKGQKISGIFYTKLLNHHKFNDMSNTHHSHCSKNSNSSFNLKKKLLASGGSKKKKETKNIGFIFPFKSSD